MADVAQQSLAQFVIRFAATRSSVEAHLFATSDQILFGRSFWVWKLTTPQHFRAAQWVDAKFTLALKPLGLELPGGEARPTQNNGHKDRGKEGPRQQGFSCRNTATAHGLDLFCVVLGQGDGEQGPVLDGFERCADGSSLVSGAHQP